jgi:hypothetical protein
MWEALVAELKEGIPACSGAYVILHKERDRNASSFGRNYAKVQPEKFKGARVAEGQLR